MSFWDSSAFLPLILDEASSDVVAATWIEIRPTDDLCFLAALLSKYHPLKTADCFRLSSALRWCEGGTAEASFVCLDNRLRQAARKDGFNVLPEPSDTE